MQALSKLYYLIQSCDLQFFHFEDRCRDQLALTELSELLNCLQRQENLKALVLIIPDFYSGSELVRMTRGGQRKLWPNLKALYLAMGDEQWLEQIPGFKELQILSIHDGAYATRSVVSKTAKCRELRAIDVSFRHGYDIEALLGIALGCPLLHKLRLRHGSFEPMRLDKTSLSSLLRALPHLEFLELGMKFRMDAAHIQDFAVHCPRLTVLKLPKTWLCLSVAQMRTIDPLWQLELAHFGEVLFENPKRLMEPHRFSTIVTEWRRIFPKLREFPCPSDIYGLEMEEADGSEMSERDDISLGDYEENPLSVLADMEEYHSSEASDRDISTSDEGISSNGPENPEKNPSEASEYNDDNDGQVFPGELDLDYNYFGSDWFFLRVKLWNELQYGQDQFAHDRITNLWTTNFEIEKISWPVMPLEAYCDPGSY